MSGPDPATGAELAERSAILEAISTSARALLSEMHAPDAPGRLIEPLARAVGASRAYLFENHRGADGRRLMSQRYEWSDVGIASHADDPEVQDLPWDLPGLEEMAAALERGEAYARRTVELTGSFRALIESQEIRALLIVPVRVAGDAWGFVGFDECRREREWGRHEIEALRIGANLLGAVLERKRLDAELRASESSYRELFENATDLVWSIDLAGCFSSINATVTRLLGWPAEEVVGRPWEELVTEPDQREIVRTAIRRKLEQGVAETRYEVRLRRRDGGYVPFEVNSRVMVREGRPVGIHGVGRDVSERRRLEEQLRQAVKMEAVGRLAASIAHEFNHLLAAISGYAERVLSRLRANDPLRAEVQEILRTGEQAAELTRELLAFGRQQPVKPARLDLNELIQQRLPTLRRVVSDDVLVVDLTEARVGRIHADPDLVEQILVSLFVNARDAMPDGGRIELSTAVVEADELRRRGIAMVAHPAYVRLSLRDTGHGMDPAVMSRIFEPFFSTRERGRGSGLGLSTVYGIVKQCEGYIFADSHPGQGSVFHVYFPQVETPGVRRPPSGEFRVAAAPAPAALAGPRPEQVLVVEDEDLIRHLAEQILLDRGYRVISAASAAEALDLVTRFEDEIDLLVTDIVMPGLSGLDLAQRLRRRIPDLRILFMSGYSDSPLLRAGLAREGAAFLQKPFSADALERRVRELLDR
ncbi:MAG: PAS domain S-box protein [Thermoanaerobaculia bacterium]|nr:MAG: PAS domain S-box protein [Thermoanaerobaculia bacterium]